MLAFVNEFASDLLIVRRIWQPAFLVVNLGYGDICKNGRTFGFGVHVVLGIPRNGNHHSEQHCSREYTNRWLVLDHNSDFVHGRIVARGIGFPEANVLARLFQVPIGRFLDHGHFRNIACHHGADFV